MYRSVAGGFRRQACLGENVLKIFFLGWIWNFDFFFGSQNFHLDAPVSWSLLRLTYTCDFTPNRLKSSGIGKWKMSESFVKIELTVWEIWSEKWQGGPWGPPTRKLGLTCHITINSNGFFSVSKTMRKIRSVFFDFCGIPPPQNILGWVPTRDKDSPYLCPPR